MEVNVRKVGWKTEASQSGTQVGTTMEGKLQDDIVVGKPITLTGGERTSAVERVYIENERIHADTATSKYEITPLDMLFHDAWFKNEQGNVAAPPDTLEARLDDRIIDTMVPNEQGDTERMYINKNALQGILLEAHNGEIFRAVDGRLFVLTRVKNIHVPFYRNDGTWQPFFGYTGKYFIESTPEKGSAAWKEIERVQNILNKNLVVPGKLLSADGQVVRPRGRGLPAEIVFDIGRHLKYQNVVATEFSNKETNDVGFIRYITGYNPKNVENDGASKDKWVKEVLSHFRA